MRFYSPFAKNCYRNEYILVTPPFTPETGDLQKMVDT